MKKQQIDSDKIDKLISQFSNLSSFEEVKLWDYEVKIELENINEYRSALENDVIILNEELEQSKKEHKSKPLLKRLLSNNNKEKYIEDTKQKINTTIEQLNNIYNKLSEWIDLTPDNKNEANEMLKELKYAKKELQIKKRELIAQKAETRKQTIINKSNVPIIAFMNPKIRRYYNTHYDYLKYKSIFTIEELQSELDKQINFYDRRINWIERIKK